MSEASLERTTSTLLSELRHASNQTAWSELDRRYRPILEAVARRMGLAEADAEDAAQETMLQFVRDYRRGRYDRSKGRLRVWVHGILRHRVQDSRRRHQARGEARGDSMLQQVAGADELEQLWDEECRRKILADAVGMLAQESGLLPSTIEAFRRYALEQQPPAQVAADLGVNVRVVYLSKHRCAKALKDIVARLRSAYEEG